MATANPGKPHRSVNLTVSPEIKPEAITEVFQSIYKLAGCRTCGLGGFDVHIQVGDPALQLPSVSGVIGTSILAQ